MQTDPFSMRVSEGEDEKRLVEWLIQPGVLKWFPLSDLREVEDASRIWMGYAKQGASFTALWEGVPCGSAVLYIPPFQKLAHQCLFAIIVDETHRGKGIGTRLLQEVIAIARDQFSIELLHLEVYDGNPAIGLYRKLGFEQYGYQRRFIKDEGAYLGKILMQKCLS